MKTIAIDGRELEGKPTGVGNYLQNILFSMDVPENLEVQIFFKNEIPQPQFDRVEPVLLKSPTKNVVWFHTTLATELRRRNVDLFFSPTPNCIPMFQGIQAATIHDLSYFLYPEWFAARDRWIRKVSTRYALHRASRIYVVSAHVRAEILKRFGTSPDRLVITPNAVHPKKIDASLRQIIRQSYGYENKRMILYVGSIFQRRHLPILIQAMQHMDDNSILVLIGENRTFPYLDLKQIASKYSVDARVIFLEYASTKTVEDYYRMADVFVYLSTYEGFGVPPLEAMSYGVPVILSRTPAMDEIYQYSALFVPDITAKSLAHSIGACFTDDELRERLIESGLAQVERSRWADTARIILQDWEQLLVARS